MNNRKAITISVVAGLLMGCTALLLGHLQASQRLGTPGVVVSNDPIHDENGKVAATNSVRLPPFLLDCHSEASPVHQVELNWLPPDTTYGRRLYTAADGFVSLISVVLMGTDRTSIHKPEYCLDGQGWKVESSDEEVLPIEKPSPYELRVMKLITSRTERGADGKPVLWKGVYLYWFVADRQQTARHGERMWWMARDMVMLGVLQRWAYVTCFSFCQPGQEQATFERMKKIIAAAVPQIHVDPAGTAPAPPPDRASIAR